MKLKTIKELNEKIWYRLIKVIYLLALIVVLVSYNLIIFGNGIRQLNLDKTLVKCNDKNNYTFSLSGAQLYLGNHDLDNYSYKGFYQNSLNEYRVKTILAKCRSVNADTINVDDYQRVADIQKDSPNLSKDEFMAKFNNDRKNDPANILLSYDYQQFDITPEYTYMPFVEGFILGNVVIALIFVFFQRIFYYIFLGKIFPKTNESNNLS